jgi:hypothetical protein
MPSKSEEEAERHVLKDAKRGLDERGLTGLELLRSAF